jgi:hypothetical protein
VQKLFYFNKDFKEYQKKVQLYVGGIIQQEESFCLGTLGVGYKGYTK